MIDILGRLDGYMDVLIPKMMETAPVAYAVLAAADFLCAILLFLLGFWAGRLQWCVRIALSVVFLLHGLSMTFLAFTEGASPVVHIDRLRPYIYLARHIESASTAVLCVLLLWLLVVAIRFGKAGSNV